MSTGIEPLVAAAWLTSTLTSDTALATALGTTVAGMPARVWSEDAPLGTPEPFIVFNLQADGVDTQGVNATIIFTRPLYTVRVVKQTTNVLDLTAAAKRLHVLLHKGRGMINVSGGIVTGSVRAARERPFYQEYNNDRGFPYRALGGVYRLYIGV